MSNKTPTTFTDFYGEEYTKAEVIELGIEDIRRTAQVADGFLIYMDSWYCVEHGAALIEEALKSEEFFFNPDLDIFYDTDEEYSEVIYSLPEGEAAFDFTCEYAAADEDGKYIFCGEIVQKGIYWDTPLQYGGYLHHIQVDGNVNFNDEEECLVCYTCLEKVYSDDEIFMRYEGLHLDSDDFTPFYDTQVSDREERCNECSRLLVKNKNQLTLDTV